MTENDDIPLSHGDSAKFIGVSVPTFKKILSGEDATLLPSTQVGERRKWRPSILRGYLETRTRRESDR